MHTMAAAGTTVGMSAAFSGEQSGGSSGNRPNIVIVSWHDTGRHFGCYGIDTVSTPNVDRLAAEGLRLSNAYTCSPVCGPSRGAAMTGRYPTCNGLYGQPHEEWNINPDEQHLAQRLKDIGYRTCVCGFQHETAKGGEPELGFEEVRANRPEKGIWFPPVPRASKVVDAGLDWLDEQTGGGKAPCYLQIGFWETHRPYIGPGIKPDDSRGITVPPYLVDTPEAQRDCAQLQGSVKAADEAVGRLLDGLDKRGLKENTLVVFWIDHGLPLPRAKLTGYDPGLEIAMIMRWPGRIQPGVSDRLVSNVDLLPTLAELTDLPHDERWQGMSFADACGPAYHGAPPREEIYACCYMGDLRMIHTDRWKLIRNLEKLRGYKAPVDLNGAGHYVVQKDKGLRKVAPVELYDLENDPLEQRDLSDKPEYADQLKALDARLIQWMRDCDDPALKGPTLWPRWRAFLDEVSS